VLVNHRILTTLYAVFLLSCSAGFAADLDERLALDSMPEARFEFRGPVGERLRANVDHWLLRAPQANPGMLDMFRVRDRQPVPQLVPWAGEFVGKYLISAVQALRMTDDPRLREQVSQVVTELMATQADDGYLGPFPQEVRLLKHWDLWGHYHVIYALLLWHEHAQDARALDAARKAAGLVCATYLDSGRRVFDAGDHEMNMAILTALAMLHRVTGEPRYLRMAREVEKDWERAGDYLRAGLDGREFFQSPRPRWESLHDLQGLVELWRITGETKYRDSFEHHWRSIRRWDRRNTGGFSSGEQATGNPFAPTAIETCCTVAWLAMTIDYLRVTGDPRAADELELSTLNGGLGAQHPSGRWWTYNTPMDGVREASAHTIVFQSRAGTPELNCCSVNAPRVLGMLSEWAFMRAPDGFAVNWYGPFSVSARLQDEAEVRLVCESNYPRDGVARFRVELPDGRRKFALHFRVPAWAATVGISVNNAVVSNGEERGRFHRLERRWETGDEVELKIDLAMRSAAGANEMAGKVSLYRGPLLFAYDQAFNDFDEWDIPAIELEEIDQWTTNPAAHVKPAFVPEPWVLLDLAGAGDRRLRLVDFASAGAAGRRYRTWLSSTPTPPAPAFTRLPPDGARVPLNEIGFRWRGPRNSGAVSYRVELATNDWFGRLLFSTNATTGRLTVDLRELSPRLADEARVWWRVVTVTHAGETIPDVPPAFFIVSPRAPALPLPAEPKLGPDGELLVHALRGTRPPEFGQVKRASFTSRDDDGTELNGRDQMIVYDVPAWPEEEFTVSLRVRIGELPDGRIGQVFSAWASGMDDPLRIVVEKGQLFARIEAGVGHSTPGAAIETNRWYAISAVKRGATLQLFLDGKLVGTSAAPDYSLTQAKACALGGNPRYSGNEFLSARLAEFKFHGRALTAEEVQELAVPREVPGSRR
jgi:uncharacterized protein